LKKYFLENPPDEACKSRSSSDINDALQTLLSSPAPPAASVRIEKYHSFIVINCIKYVIVIQFYNCISYIFDNFCFSAFVCKKIILHFRFCSCSGSYFRVSQTFNFQRQERSLKSSVICQVGHILIYQLSVQAMRQTDVATSHKQSSHPTTTTAGPAATTTSCAAATTTPGSSSSSCDLCEKHVATSEASQTLRKITELYVYTHWSHGVYFCTW